MMSEETLADLALCSRQQLRAVAQPKPPKELAKHFDKETYSRATAYSISKLRYSLIKTVFDQTYQYYMIKYHVYAFAWNLSQEWMDAIGLSPSRTVSLQLLASQVTSTKLIPVADHAFFTLDRDLDWC